MTGSYDPAAQPDVLGRRQRRSRLEQRAAARRQPLHRLGRRARRRHRQAEVALPVHAARSSTTTTRCRCRCSSTSLARRAAQGDGLGQPQRQLLRARSRDGKVPARQAVREGELDERRSTSAAGRTRRRSRRASRPGRAIRAGRTGTRRRTARAPGSSTCRRGKTTRRIFGGTPVEYQEGRTSAAAVNRSVRAGARRAGGPGIRRGPINNWTEAAGHGAVIALDAGDRRAKWKFPMTDVTDSGILTTGVGPAVHGRPRRLLPGARRAHRLAAVEGESRRADHQRPDHATKWTASSTSPRFPGCRCACSACGNNTPAEVGRRSFERAQKSSAAQPSGLLGEADLKICTAFWEGCLASQAVRILNSVV